MPPYQLASTPPCQWLCSSKPSHLNPPEAVPLLPPETTLANDLPPSKAASRWLDMILGKEGEVARLN